MKSILLVEENSLLRAASEKALSLAGYKVVTASNGAMALILARHHKPDLVLLDMMMPKPGQPEVFRELKDNSTTAEVPVVVLSGEKQSPSSQKEQVSFLRKSDMNMKNFPEAVVHAVKKVFRNRRVD